MRAVRSTQLTRRAFWADPTIHFMGQVAVESREGSEEPQLTRCAFWPDPIGGPPKGKVLQKRLQTVKLIDILAEKLI